jgi:glycerol-3-phosphate dehydrogenase (NAD(P)+)
MSAYSRNRQAGILIGKGKTAQDAMREVGAVVEGYYAAKAAKELAEKIDIDMPISLETYRVLYEDKHPMTAMKDLMSRSRRSEQNTGAEIWVT